MCEVNAKGGAPGVSEEIPEENGQELRNLKIEKFRN
jgi:hypothetical protein